MTINAPASSEVDLLTKKIRDLSPATIDLLLRIVPILARIDDNGSSGMMHIGFDAGLATKLRIDTNYDLQ